MDSKNKGGGQKVGEVVTDWLHLDYRPKNAWILPIWTAVNKATETGKCEKVTPGSDLGELGLGISTRLEMLPLIAARVREETNKLFQATKNHKDEHVFKEGKDGVAFPNKGIEKDIYLLIIDIDSLLFELKATCDLIEKLFIRLYNHAGKKLHKKKGGKLIKDDLEREGEDASWLADLNNLRVLFIHKTTPYLAIDISSADKYDILIMKENLTSFSDNKKFIKLSKIDIILQGFHKSMIFRQRYLVALFENM